MDKQKIKRFIEEEGIGYQKIDLPYGLSTPGDKRIRFTNLILKDVKDKTVLDLGSWLGYFCFEAVKKGASKAVGLEINKDRVRQAKKLAKILNVKNVEFKNIDITKALPEQKFDVVLCLNVLHHLENPLTTILKLMEITQDKLIIEFAGFGKYDSRKFGYSKTFEKLRNYPLMWVAEGNGYILGRGQKYFFTAKAFKHILSYHRHLFGKIEIFDTGFKDRKLLIAHRRKIKNLLIVSGPTSSGKTTFIDKLLKNKYPEILKKLNINNISSYENISADVLYKFKKSRIENMILHYDSLYPLMEEDILNYENDTAFDILKCAENIKIITIKTSGEILRKQLLNSEFGGKNPKDMDLYSRWEIMPNLMKNIIRKITGMMRGFLFFDRFLKSVVYLPRHKKIHTLYNDDKKIDEIYKKWFDFCKKVPHSKHYIFNDDKETKTTKV